MSFFIRVPRYARKTTCEQNERGMNGYVKLWWLHNAYNLYIMWLDLILCSLEYETKKICSDVKRSKAKMNAMRIMLILSSN